MLMLTIAVIAPTSLHVLDGVPRNPTLLLALLPRPSTLVLGKLPPIITKMWTHALPVALHHRRTRRFLLP